jgi:hypothetical protein
MANTVITIDADFNNRDADGRLRLSRLAMHRATPFEEIAKRQVPILFVDGDDVVEGTLIHSDQDGWLGEADWSTLSVREHWPKQAALA